MPTKHWLNEKTYISTLLSWMLDMQSWKSGRKCPYYEISENWGFMIRSDRDSVFKRCSTLTFRWADLQCVLPGTTCLTHISSICTHQHMKITHFTPPKIRYHVCLCHNGAALFFPWFTWFSCNSMLLNHKWYACNSFCVHAQWFLGLSM